MLLWVVAGGGPVAAQPRKFDMRTVEWDATRLAKLTMDQGTTQAN